MKPFKIIELVNNRNIFSSKFKSLLVFFQNGLYRYCFPFNEYEKCFSKDESPIDSEIILSNNFQTLEDIALNRGIYYDVNSSTGFIVIRLKDHITYNYLIYVELYFIYNLSQLNIHYKFFIFNK